MTILGLSSALEESIVKIRFVKLDGSERVMLATRCENFILYDFMQKMENIDKTTQGNIIRVWDTEKGAWRSIRNDSITSWEVA